MTIEVLSRIPDRLEHPTPILFVHGAWQSAWCWEKFFMPYFAAKGYAVHALSLRGHGQSDGAASLRRYRIKDYVTDVHRVAERLSSPPIVVGHSLGGHVVQKYLEKYPAPAAVLMASVPVGGIIKMIERLARRHPLLFTKVNFYFRLYPFVSTPQIAKEMLFSEGMPDDEFDEYYHQLQDESYFSFLDMLFLSPIKPRLVKSPVLVMGAENDNLVYRRDVRKTGRAYHHPAVIFPGMAHEMMLERDWRRVADTIVSWLANRGL